RVLHFIGRASPPSKGTMYRRLSGRINWPLWHFTKTIQRRSGVIFGKLLLMPLLEAPRIGSGRPPRPSLKGIRYRLYWIWVSCGSLANSAGGAPGGNAVTASPRAKTIHLPSRDQTPSVCT